MMKKELFEIGDQFTLNGRSVKIISGSFPYFRTVPEYWQDRLEKMGQSLFLWDRWYPR